MGAEDLRSGGDDKAVRAPRAGRSWARVKLHHHTQGICIVKSYKMHEIQKRLICAVSQIEAIKGCASGGASVIILRDRIFRSDYSDAS